MTEAGSPPARLTSFVGRERELADLAELFGTARLITLTGPGGSGKTRLALEFAASEGTPAAHVVDLAPIIDAGAMVAAIAATLGVHDQGDPIEDTLAASIGEADTFLVLDNLEQIPEAGLQVAALLAAAPGLRVLATSRAPLHVRGEHEVPVTPLADDAAVELFADRARAIDPRFTMDEDAASVASVCARLDGLPLAIELAAARTRLFTPAALLDRLEQQVPVLARGTGGRARPAAHPARHDRLELRPVDRGRAAGVHRRRCVLRRVRARCRRSGRG